MVYGALCELLAFTVLLLGVEAEKQVAFIVGGSEDLERTDMEIYVSDQNETSCADNVQIPSLPARLISSAGLYLDSVGIVICGGKNVITNKDRESHECFTLPNFNSEWQVSSPGHFAMADMLLPYPHGQKDSYWVIGYGTLNNTTLYKDQEDNFWKTGVSLPLDIQFQCSVTVEFSGSTQYLVIGGQYFPDHTPENQTKTHTYCKDHNSKTCPEGNGIDWVWTMLPLIQEVGDYSLHACSSFTDPHYGESVIVAGGDKSSVFHIEECATNGTLCKWIRNNSLDLVTQISRSKIINLNGHPVMFGGIETAENYLAPLNKVWRFEHASKDGDYIWKEIPPMRIAHAKHVVITVPELFICNKTASTSSVKPTSTTSTSSTTSTTSTKSTSSTTSTTSTTKSTSTTTISTTSTTTTSTTSSTSETTTSSISTISTAASTSRSTSSYGQTNQGRSTLSYAIEGQCVQHDSRGKLWIADNNQVATILCPKSANPGEESYARWKCLEEKFETAEPDRTECVHDWLEDIEYMMEHSNETSTNISAVMRDKIRNSNLYGGDILRLTRLMEPLAEKHARHMLENTEAINREFTENMFRVTDAFLNSSIAWMEINDESQRYDSSSKVLSSVDSVGYLLLTTLPASGCLSGKHNFTLSLLTVQIVNLATDCEQLACFSFSTGSICAPSEIYESLSESTAANVVTEFIVKNIDQSMFPNTMITNQNNQSSIIGLSIANGTAITIPKGKQPVRITFLHEEQEQRPGSEYCVFWDLSGNAWSDNGCFYNPDLSNLYETTCDCYHLTNFGIIMDFTGNADPFDVFLNYFSTVTLVISMIFIFSTEVVLFYLKFEINNNNSSRKRYAERQRNLWLFLGQLSFLALVSQGEAVSLVVCEVFGAVTHLTWMFFWTWTGIEGYFLYHSITRVFKTGTLYVFIYFIGYGVPLAVVLSLFTVSRFLGMDSYVRFYGDDQTPVCWLHEDFMWVFLAYVGMVLAFNIAVTARAVGAAYQSAGFRNVEQSQRLLAALRNTLILSFLLGLGFILGFFPATSPESPQQYMFVILNTSSGVFVFISSILVNDNVTSSLKRTLTLSNHRSSIATVSTTLSRSDSRTLTFLRNMRPSISHSLGIGSLKNDIEDVCQHKPHVMLSIQESSTRIIMKITVDKELDGRIKQN